MKNFNSHKLASKSIEKKKTKIINKIKCNKKLKRI